MIATAACALTRTVGIDRAVTRPLSQTGAVQVVDPRPVGTRVVGVDDQVIKRNLQGYFVISESELAGFIKAVKKARECTETNESSNLQLRSFGPIVYPPVP